MDIAQKQLHSSLLGRYGFIIFAFLVFSAALVFSFQNMFEQRRLIEKESRIDVWFLAQTEVEYLRLLDALSIYAIEGSDFEHDGLMLRFEIFWSRLPIVLSGAQTENLRNAPGFEDTARKLLNTLREIEPFITVLAKGDAAGYLKIRSILEPWGAPLHRLLNDTLIYESTSTATEKEDAKSLYDDLLVLLVATCVGIVVLFLALYYKIREASIAEAHASKARGDLVDAIETISEAFVLFDEDDRVVLYNKKYKELHPGFAHIVEPGVRFEELIRTAVEHGSITVPEGDTETWINSCVLSHKHPGAPFESQLSNGTWLRISERRTKDGWTVGVHSDITELKSREVELRAKSELLEATLENIHQGVSVFDADLGLIARNKVYVDMFDYPEDLVSTGTPYLDLLRYNTERGDYGDDDPKVVIAEERKIAEQIARSRTGHKKVERTRPNGVTIEMTYNAMPGGGFVKTYTDITERVRAEEERTNLAAQIHASQEENLRLLMEHEAAGRRSAETRLVDAIENTYEAVILIDAKDRIVIANSQATKFFPGIANLIRPGASFPEILEEAVRRGAFSHLPDSDHDARQAELLAASGVAEMRLADGRWLRMSRSGTRDGGAVVIWSDITKMMQREDALRFAKEQAEAANSSKTAFLASMSHELRTPLNAIIGFSEAMTVEIFGPIAQPQYLAYAHDIMKSGRHLVAIINDILDFAKSEEGKLRLHLEDLNADQVLETCHMIIHDQCAQEGISLSIERQTELPEIRADAAKLRQILLNILSNAMKFTPSGGRVVLSVGAGPDGGLVFVVNDTGIGMRPEDIATAFEPFGQIDNSLARKYEGTGLGLPLTKKLVELHGGALQLDSSLNEGTTVTIRLPAAPPSTIAA